MAKVEIISKKSANTRKKKVLYITNTLHYPPTGGQYLRVYNVIKALNDVVELDIFFLGEPSIIGDLNALNHIEQNCHNLYSYDTKPPLWVKGIRHYLKNFYWYYRVLRVLRRNHYDLLWLGYGNITYELVLLGILTGLPLVVDTDSVWSRYALRHIPYTSRFTEKLVWFWRGNVKRLAEFIGTNAATITTAVSEFDSLYFRKITPFKNKVQILSNFVDISLPDVDEPTQYTVKHPAICYSGSMAGPANHEAAIWLLDRVMPLLWQKHPNLTVYIVGSGPSEELLAKRNERVIITGTVNSVLAYLKKMDGIVVPLHFESGTRYKILEAWSAGCAIVSTTLGAEGLHYEHGKHILIADEPENFASEVDRVLKNGDLRESLIRNGNQLLKSDYSLEAGRKEILKILDTIWPRKY